jgi:hypothetical protein
MVIPGSFIALRLESIPDPGIRGRTDHDDRPSHRVLEEAGFRLVERGTTRAVSSLS